MWLSENELTNDEIIAEFDQWVTPALEKIRDTAKFATQLSDLERAVDALSLTWTEGNSIEDAVTAAISQILDNISSDAVKDVQGVFATLSLVTAQSDNSAKCQYPIWRRRNKENEYPQISGKKISFIETPNELKQSKVATTIVSLYQYDAGVALRLAKSYTDFILGDKTDKRQLEVLIRAFQLTGESEASLLLAPLAAFQVRGSVAASGGHGPEAIMRSYLDEWGLTSPEWFNHADVVAAHLADWLAGVGDSCVTPQASGRELVDDKGEKAKTRGFDFVIPYQLPDVSRRIFIQSQFYAGDSGSVSHKNVDQADKARKGASALFPGARFVELVDGAGYCSSLRKDLRHLLFAPDTTGFVQLRSIPVRMRRLLQQSGIVSPLEVSLLVMECKDDGLPFMDLFNSLVGENESKNLVEMAHKLEWVYTSEDGVIHVSESKVQVVREYQQLDSIVANSRKLEDSERKGAVIVSGFGANFGIPQGEYDASILKSRWVDQGIIEVI